MSIARVIQPITIDEEIQTVSDNGRLLLTNKQQNNQYYLYSIDTGEKRNIHLGERVYNIRFCIDDEFLVYTENGNGFPVIGLLALWTNKTNPVIGIGEDLNCLKSEVIIF